MKGRLRRVLFGLMTITGLARRGWFIPYRHAPEPRRAAYAALERLFVAARPRFGTLLDDMDRCAASLKAIPVDGPGLRWRQSWFPRLDAAAAYAIVRRERPLRIIEVGSGHSTRFLARAIADGGLTTQLTAIDPAPRASIAAVAASHIPDLVENVDPAIFRTLGAGDMLFIDSSHVAMPGGDVDTLLLDILPALPAGVLLHVHDIFLPDAYPWQWAWRGYNEQIAIGTLIQGGGYDIVWSSRYVATRLAPDVAKSAIGRLPLADGAFETSLWLRKLQVG
jgi:hypothetical protein